MSKRKSTAKMRKLSPKKLSEALEKWDKMREELVKNKLQMNEKEKYTFAITLLTGIIIGIFSNIIVANIYRFIDGKFNFSTLIFTLIIFIILIFVIYSWIDRIKFGIEVRLMDQIFKETDFYEDIEEDS